MNRKMNDSLRLVLSLLLWMMICQSALARIFNDKSIAEKVPAELKSKVDALLQEKLQIFLRTFFGEDFDHATSQVEENLFRESRPYKGGEYLHFQRPQRVRRGLSNETSNSSAPLDGGYSSWSAFGPCSVSCGGGTQQRMRTCDSPSPANGGNNCSLLGNSKEMRSCNVFPCMAESYTLKHFDPLPKVSLRKPCDVKKFTIEKTHYFAVAYMSELHVFKWNRTRQTFSLHGPKIPLQSAYCFDVFSKGEDHLMVIGEGFKVPYLEASVSRVLRYNKLTDTFDDRDKIIIPVSSHEKVKTFKVHGKPYAAFIAHASQSPGLEITTTVCDTNTAILKCAPDAKITIKSAFYGRKSWSVCAHGWYFNINECSAPTVFPTIAALCDNRSSCTIKAPPDGVPDPCPVFTKYLTIVHVCDRYSVKTNPKIYVWENNAFQLLLNNKLEVYGAKDIEAFSIHHKSFLAVANSKNDEGETQIDSEIFIYSPTARAFESFQKLRTEAANDWEFFSIGEGLTTEYFLAVANMYKVDSKQKRFYETESVIYKWNWNLFVPFQCIKTTNAQKWKSIKGKDGRFLLALKSGNNGTISYFGYDGWRFFRYKTKTDFPGSSHPISLIYSFSIDNQTMLLAHHTDFANNVSKTSNLYEVKFVKEFAKFSMINHTLSKIHEVNGSLNKLSARVESMIQNMVLLNGTNNITGQKTFEDVTVLGDITTVNGSFGTVQLSAEDQETISRQRVLQLDIVKRENELQNLLAESQKLLSKTKNQVVTGDYKFTGPITIDSLTAADIKVSGTVNHIDVNRLANNALYIDQSYTIWGNKTFSDDVIFRKSLTVNGQIDGVNTSDLVLLTTDQVIFGRKTFAGDVTFYASGSSWKNLEIRGLVNGHNISHQELITVWGDQTVTGNYNFTENITLEKDMTVGLVNSRNLTKLYEDAVLLHSKQKITAHQTFAGDVDVKRNLIMAPGKLVDGVDVSALSQGVLSRTKDQNITGSIHFNGNVSFNDALRVEDLINGIDIAKDIVYLSKDQVITGDKVFIGNLTLHDNIDVAGLVNGVNISGDLMTVSDDQVITGQKTFDNDLEVQGDIMMEENMTVDGVDVSELAENAMYKHIPQTITGDKVFERMNVNDMTVKSNSSCYVLELLTNLTEKTVKTNTPANITGTKTFTKKLSILNDLNVAGYLNGVSVPQDMVLLNNPGIIRGVKTFQNVVAMMGDVKVEGTVNGQNITELYQTALRLTGDQVITGKKTFKNGIRVKKNLNVTESLNSIKIPDDLVLLKGNEEIRGHKTFGGPVHVESLFVDEMTVHGLIDGVNITELNRTLIRKSGDQTIRGDVSFEKGFVVTGNLNTGGNINGYNLTALNEDAMRITGDQVITGRKTFASSVSVTGTLTVDGRVDNVNLTELSLNAVSLDGDQKIHGQVNFSSDITVEGNVEVSGLVNGINISRLQNEALYKVGNQTLIGKLEFKNLTVKGDVDLNGTINDIDVSEDVVKLHGNETMAGQTFVDDMLIRGNMNVTGLINGVNVSQLEKDAVKLNGLQIIEAKKTFSDDLFILGNFTVDGLVDGVNITELSKTVLDVDSDQIIHGSYVFKDNITFIDPIQISGLVNDINITGFSQNVVTKSTNQTILGEKIFKEFKSKRIDVWNDINVRGLINEIDLSELDKRTVRIYGKHIIDGIKAFTKKTTFEGSLIVNGTVNGFEIPQDLVLLSGNQTVHGKKTFKNGIRIEGDLSVSPGSTVDGVDVSELAKNAVYLNKNQIISSPIQFATDLHIPGMRINGLVNGVNISKDILLLKSGKQAVTGKMKFEDVIVEGDLNAEGRISGVDLHEINRTSMFTDRDNVVTSKKIIIGDVHLKENVTAKLIDGVDNLQQHYLTAKGTLDPMISKLNASVMKQQQAIDSYVESTQTLRQKLDYFVSEQIMSVDSNIASFDAIGYNDTAMLITADLRTNKNSTIYSRNSATKLFVPANKIAFFGAADINIFNENGQIYTAVANSDSSNPGADQSAIYSLNVKDGFSYSKRDSYDTRRPKVVHVTAFGRSHIVTFSNTYNATSSTPNCVSTTPLLYNLTSGLFRPLVSFFGCGIVKVITKQIDSKHLFVAFIQTTVHGGKEVLVYTVSDKGVYAPAQTITTYVATDLIFLEANGELFLAIANQYQSSDVSVEKDARVPILIYRHDKTLKRFIRYQDLVILGSQYLDTFTIDKYAYLIATSKDQGTTVFQFFGSGKFAKVNSIRSKGMKNAIKLRAWTVKDEIFVGLLSTETTDHNTLEIFRAVKSVPLTATQLKAQIEAAKKTEE